ncbi:methylglyoxal synthase [candidate division WOR-3 bacterium JGI_Cruoil_03_44_89]|uniref:Methylglyoxal synthase n=1 Tax=candidate division WOR-3 bacterium JGI_Cruoil_03_44_89 TaxID=1973748 RepID=A0A235BY24_UNCW3|nr:MAG: methylglyoxal synthase [candidate division WOR-3 bacterium JGI_Cruoil_03_44_89]
MEKGHKIGVVSKSRKKAKTKTIALIAHDAKKVDIVMFANKHKDKLAQCELIATGATGRAIREKPGLEVKQMLGGPEGGDLQIAGLIASGEIDLVIFLRDPLTAQPHDPDIFALLRACDVHNIPLATNLASSEALIGSLL